MWPFFNRREIRESSFTDALVAQIVASAGGAVSARPTATGALEACAGLIGRAFSAASVEGPTMLTAALTPQVLNLIGRELVRRGEAVFNVDVPVDRVGVNSMRLILMCRAVFDPEAWLYRLNLAGPSETTTIGHREASGVLHFKWAYEPARPWRGLSPIAAAALAGRLSAETAKALADESSGPRGSLLPVPVDGSDPTVDALRGDLKNLNGQTALVESMKGGWDKASNSREAPADWIARRLGAAPPAGLVSLHELASREIALACGVPTALLAESPTGTGTREAWRQFLFGTVAPLGKLVADELSRKLDAPISLTWADLRASDLAGRARAFQSMVGGGMELGRAAGLAGLMDPTD